MNISFLTEFDQENASEMSQLILEYLKKNSQTYTVDIGHVLYEVAESMQLMPSLDSIIAESKQMVDDFAKENDLLFADVVAAAMSAISSASSYMDPDLSEAARAVMAEPELPSEPQQERQRFYTYDRLVALLGLLVAIYSVILNSLPDKQLEELREQQEAIIKQQDVIIEQQSEEIAVLNQLLEAAQDVRDLIDTLDQRAEDSLDGLDDLSMPPDDIGETPEDLPLSADDLTEAPNTLDKPAEFEDKPADRGTLDEAQNTED